MVRHGVTFREPVAPPTPAPTQAVPASDAARELEPAPVVEADPRPVLLPAVPSHSSRFRQRFGVVYDTQGPKVRLGVGWAIAVIVALGARPLRPYGLAGLFAIVAGAAAAQILDAHRGRDTTSDRRVAAYGASALPILATAGGRVLGVGILALVVVSLVGVVSFPDAHRALFSRAGHIVAAATICGGAAASLVLLADYEIGAVIILLTFVLVYDASDYVVGSGASNGVEGPLAGILFIAVTAFLFAETHGPPFHGRDIWSFAVLAMLGCPLGQLIASALLPQAGSRAPALRRLDSLLVVAPAWAGLVGLYLARVT